MLTLSPNDLPEALQRLPQPPERLYVEGNLAALLQRPRVAIVGSRKLTPYGRQVTAMFAAELAQQGVVIVSGLALGVDSVAHQAALDAGGLTMAVLPSSLEAVYPASHRQLAATIVRQGGALVSEYPSGSAVMKHQFIARNRLIAGLSNALLVTEAALKSGSLHTARFALEQGIDVYAVPGSITSPTSEGANNLLKSGALVATKTPDLYQRLGITLDKQVQLAVGDNEYEQLLLNLLASGVQDGQELLAACKLPIAEFNQHLTMLELNGKIRSLGANQWSL